MSTLIHEKEILVEETQAREWLRGELEDALESLDQTHPLIEIGILGVTVTVDFKEEEVLIIG